MRILLPVFLTLLVAAACRSDSLLTAMNRGLVEGTVTLDGAVEPAEVTMYREATGAIGDSEEIDSIGFYQIADEWEGPCGWRVEVVFTEIVMDSAFLASLNRPPVQEHLGCTRQTQDFILTTN